MLRVNSRVMSPQSPVSFSSSFPPSPPPSSLHPLSFLIYVLAFVHEAMLRALGSLDSIPTDPLDHGRSCSLEFENTAISVTAPAAALCVHTYVYLVLHPVPTAPSSLPSSLKRAIDRDVVCPSAVFYRADCSRIGDVLSPRSWEGTYS